MTRTMRMVLIGLSLALADAAMAQPESSISGSRPDPAATDLLALDVPYLPQTDALCGGAAVAMIFRYWGSRHADIQQFATLVDGGGISTDVLTQAVRDRQWNADVVSGSTDTIRGALAAGHPLVLLLEDRPGRYHYVVVVAIDAERVWLHDPTWGPSRPYAIARLLQTWKPANFWAMRILPQTAAPNANRPQAELDVGVRSAALPPSVSLPAAVDSCDRALAQAVADIQRQGLDGAESLLAEVRARCPDASGPLSELAGVRFAQRRFSEAASLADQAVSRNSEDTYAWDVLGASRFLQDDFDGALEAWNHLEKPYLNSVHIEGLRRTRYALVAEALRLTPNQLIDANGFRLAERRLNQLPDRLAARIAYRPEADGFAVLDVAVAERPRHPGTLVGWSVAGANALVNREITLNVPGWSGQGEVWSGSWRWWQGRPRFALAFAAPRTGQWPGVWRVQASWDLQSYALPDENLITRERQKQVTVGVSDWLTPQLRYALTAGAHGWEMGDRHQKAVSVGGELERRWLDDRVALTGAVRHWMPVSNATRFHAGSMHASIRTSPRRGFVQLAEIHAEAATEQAPRAVWPGAGDDRGRTGLLRAHPLLDGGVISGPAFGRRLVSMTVESQRWFSTPATVPVGVAIFTDLARVWRPIQETPTPIQIDLGIGLRLRAPGNAGTFRIDYARGLRDGSQAITVGVSLKDII